MPTLQDTKSNIERAKAKERAARAQLLRAKRVYTKQFRSTEKQALCALGRGLLSLYNDSQNLQGDIRHFLNDYLTRDSDREAIEAALGDTTLGRALSGVSHIPIEIVG